MTEGGGGPWDPWMCIYLSPHSKHASRSVPHLPPIDPKPAETVTAHYPSASASHQHADVTFVYADGHAQGEAPGSSHSQRPGGSVMSVNLCWRLFSSCSEAAQLHMHLEPANACRWGGVVSCPATSGHCVTGEWTPNGGPPDPRHRHSERVEADPTILTHESCDVKGKPVNFQIKPC